MSFQEPMHHCTKGHEWVGGELAISGPDSKALCMRCFHEAMASMLGEVRIGPLPQHTAPDFMVDQRSP